MPLSLNAAGEYVEIDLKDLNPPADPIPTLDDYRRAIQFYIDSVASQRGYDSGVSCVSYLNSTDPAWRVEAASFNAWRDSVWAYVNAELPKVQGGDRPQPTVEALVAELPAMAWPT